MTERADSDLVSNYIHSCAYDELDSLTGVDHFDTNGEYESTIWPDEPLADWMDYDSALPGGDVRLDELTYYFDGLGSVTGLVDESGAVGARYHYSAYGKTLACGPLAEMNPYRYTGREYDAETGLYYYRARTYDQNIGAFYQEDPKNIIIPYIYADSSPILYTDPFGKEIYLTDDIHKPLTLAIKKIPKHNSFYFIHRVLESAQKREVTILVDFFDTKESFGSVRQVGETDIHVIKLSWFSPDVLRDELLREGFGTKYPFLKDMKLTWEQATIYALSHEIYHILFPKLTEEQIDAALILKFLVPIFGKKDDK